MVKVGRNFGSNDKCPVCAEAEDTQDHLFDCSMLDQENINSDRYDLTEHIRRLEAAIRKREVVLEI